MRRAGAPRRLPRTEHTSRPWRIHEIAPDFHLEDVWALPTPGGPHELPRLVSAVFATEFPAGAPLLVRALWEARWKIGALLGWDGEGAGVGTGVPSLRDRLPSDVALAPMGPQFAPFTPVYSLGDEWAGELANRTVHAVMHLGWVEAGPGADPGGHRGQMAVLVKPNGRLGAVYMAAIRPVRHLVVYPALLRSIERSWRASA